MFSTRRLLLLILALGVLVGSLVLALPSAATDPVYTPLFSNLAIKGYDPVAYFEQGRAVEGSADFEFDWQGATWRFASSEHRDLFAADPEHYAPQYGGYCAYAISRGDTAGIDPQSWKIVDGKLYLNYNQKIQQKWEADMQRLIELADQKWPEILAD